MLLRAQDIIERGTKGVWNIRKFNYGRENITVTGPNNEIVRVTFKEGTSDPKSDAPGGTVFLSQPKLQESDVVVFTYVFSIAKGARFKVVLPGVYLTTGSDQRGIRVATQYSSDGTLSPIVKNAQDSKKAFRRQVYKGKSTDWIDISYTVSAGNVSIYSSSLGIDNETILVSDKKHVFNGVSFESYPVTRLKSDVLFNFANFEIDGTKNSADDVSEDSEELLFRSEPSDDGLLQESVAPVVAPKASISTKKRVGSSKIKEPSEVEQIRAWMKQGQKFFAD